MTRCLGLWLKADFGRRLHGECHGCTRMHRTTDPLSAEVKQPPAFGDKCPLRVDEKS